MPDDADQPSVFEPSDFVLWSDPDRTKPSPPAETAEFEAAVRADQGVAPSRAYPMDAPSFLRQLTSRIGKSDARKVVSFVAAWIVASEQLGHPATAVEYAQHWEVGDATAYRELRSFKSAFPTERNPERLAWALGWARAPWIPLAEYRRVVDELTGQIPSDYH